MQFKRKADKQKLLKELCSDDMNVRMRAAFALVKIGSPEVVPALVEELNNGSGIHWAAPALANIGSSEAVAGLVEALNNKDRAIRLYAASALGAITESKVVYALIEALNDEYKTVRENAIFGNAKPLVHLTCTIHYTIPVKWLFSFRHIGICLVK